MTEPDAAEAVDAPAVEAAAVEAAAVEAPEQETAVSEQPAVQRVAAAAAAIESVRELPLSEHAERYQQLHAVLQTELADIAGV